MEQSYNAPAVVVLSRWDHGRNVPVVFPSRRDGNNNHAVLLSETEVATEVAELEALNLLTSIPYRIDVVPPDEAQAFIDARAEGMVKAHQEAGQDVGLLNVYGFSPTQLRDMGYGPKGEVL